MACVDRALARPRLAWHFLGSGPTAADIQSDSRLSRIHLSGRLRAGEASENGNDN